MPISRKLFQRHPFKQKMVGTQSGAKKNPWGQKNLSKKIEIARHEKSRAGRLQQTLPDIALRAKLIANLLDLGDVVIVDDDFGTKRREYLDQLRTAKETRSVQPMKWNS